MQLPTLGRRRLIIGGVAIVALGLGGTGIAIARSGDDSKPSYTSSVQVANTAGEGKNGDAALAGLAKITPEQAKAAALTAVPGTAGQVELENEDGNVVFGVEVTTATGARMDVKVDAGNGKVLAQSPDDGDESKGDGKAETESTSEANEPTTQATR